jgi:oligosaccharide repeat unit polymerase
MHSIALDQRTLIPAAAAPGTISRRKALLMIQVFLLALLAGIGMVISALQIDAETMLYPACLATTLSMIWILWSWYALRGTLFEPYPLFMISAGLFNGGQAILEVFGLNEAGVLSGRVSPDLITPALFLVALCTMALHTGALLSLQKARTQTVITRDATARCRAARMAGWMMLGVAAVPLFSLLSSSLSLVLDYGYMGMYRREDSVSVTQALSGFAVPGIIFLLAGSPRRRWTHVFCLVLAVGYTVIYLFLGSRSSAAMGCIAVAWVFERSIRRIPRSVIAGLALGALLIFPLVRETRGMSGRDRLSVGNEVEVLSNLENPVADSLSEMGHSLITITHTLQLVPSVRNYDYGASYLYAALTMVPNLGWEVHPTIAHGILSDWLIRTVDPTVAAAGGGLGFSFVAEAFLNFGWFGGPLWLGLLGFGLGKTFSLADSDDPAKHALVASFLSFFLVFARGEAATVVRGLVWYAVVPYILAELLTARNRRRGERR